ncbi:MAG: NAD-dependent epimerase/dehydratase family protein [Lachnospiraceae bacterium]|nr:NAD-dependent epimerase/dehydratase family protein [Lachnospiraceae bacterium]
MRVLVTGAAGYMGKHVVRKLIKNGHEVLAVDLNHKSIDSRAKILDVDIFSGQKNMYELVEKPDLCIHLAWQDGFVHNSMKHMQNLSGHFTFLKDMIEGGCKNIAVMGTMHEIGFWEGEIDENTPCKPLSQYGVAKNALRQALMLFAQTKEVNIYWLRAYYIVGDDTRNSSIFTKLLQAVEEGKKEFPFTTGVNQYDFIDVKDLAEQIVAASTQDEVTGIINVCTGKPVSLKDKVESFIKEKGLDIELKYGVFPERPYDSKIVYGNSEKIDKIMKNTNR